MSCVLQLDVQEGFPVIKCVWTVTSLFILNQVMFLHLNAHNFMYNVCIITRGARFPDAWLVGATISRETLFNYMYNKNNKKHFQ